MSLSELIIKVKTNFGLFFIILLFSALSLALKLTVIKINNKTDRLLPTGYHRQKNIMILSVRKVNNAIKNDHI